MITCPIIGKVRVTQKFGARPEVYAQFGLAGHNGIDFTGEIAGISVPVCCPFEGKVVEVGDQGVKGYGKFVRIHSLGIDSFRRTKEVVLGHLASIQSDVSSGKIIPHMNILGMMGNTGFSTAMHLHMGLRFLNEQGGTMDASNGYKGYIDFLPFLQYTMSKDMETQFVKYI